MEQSKMLSLLNEERECSTQTPQSPREPLLLITTGGTREDLNEMTSAGTDGEEEDDKEP